MALLTSHFRFGPFTMWDQPLPSKRPGVGRTGQYANGDLGELLAPTLGALTPRSVFVDDEEAADRRPAKATSADLIPLGRRDATGGARAAVDYARRS